MAGAGANWNTAFAALVRQLDLAVNANLGAVEVLYTPEDGDLFPTVGLFDEQYVLVSADVSGVEAVTPAVFLRLDDLPVDPEDDDPTLTIGGVDYRVTERRPDGFGGIVLALRRIAL